MTLFDAIIFSSKSISQISGVDKWLFNTYPRAAQQGDRSVSHMTVSDL